MRNLVHFLTSRLPRDGPCSQFLFVKQNRSSKPLLDCLSQKRIAYLTHSAPTLPRAKAVHGETYSTQIPKFVFEYLLLPPRSALRHVAPRCLTCVSNRFVTTLMSSYSLSVIVRSRLSLFHNGQVLVWSRSSDIHFKGWSIRRVSCYTFLSGCRLP